MSFGDVETNQPWFEEYLHGAGMEIYYVPLHKNFLDAFSCEWTPMVESLYLSFGVVMVGVCDIHNAQVSVV